jgi:uncharacterized protein (DUF58 family)
MKFPSIDWNAADTTPDAPYVSLAEITEIELLTLKRMREFTMGEHRSTARGSGFDFQGLRDWQPGDRPSSIDWAQSSLTNFSPLVVRDFEQPSTARVTAIADVSRSTQSGTSRVLIAHLIARAIATLGMSAVFFQDPFGLVTFDEGFGHLAAIRPSTGKGHVLHCLEAYQFRRGLEPMRRHADLASTLAGYFHSTTLVPVISDFLFKDLPEVLRELSLLNHTHDVFLVLVDSSFAFELPSSSAAWIETIDVETGQSQMFSRRRARQLAGRIREWQDHVAHTAKQAGLDIVRIGSDAAQADVALGEFVAERRLKRFDTR